MRSVRGTSPWPRLGIGDTVAGGAMYPIVARSPVATCGLPWPDLARLVPPLSCVPARASSDAMCGAGTALGSERHAAGCGASKTLVRSPCVAISWAPRHRLREGGSRCMSALPCGQAAIASIESAACLSRFDTQTRTVAATHTAALPRPLAARHVSGAACARSSAASQHA